MKIKVGNTYYDPNDIPVMLVFEDGDRELIHAMTEGNNRIAFVPDGQMTPSRTRDWMHDACPGVKKFCEGCGRETGVAEAMTTERNQSLDVNDGYREVHLCKECHEGDAPQLSEERFCEDCHRKIGKGKAVAIKLNFALDADDGYGDDAEIHLCKECHEGE